MKLKKACAVTLAAAMILGAAGCGNKAETNGTSQSGAVPEEREVQTGESQTDTEADSGQESQTESEENNDSKEDSMSGENFQMSLLHNKNGILFPAVLPPDTPVQTI
mgnify:CR=1 FL=1